MAADTFAESVPAHVPSHLVYDFDYYALDGSGTPVQLEWFKLREQAPGDIFWTPRYGGHWVALRAEDIEEVQMNFDLFSARPGSVIPITDHQRTHRQLPMGGDPPESTPFRALLMPAFLPREVNKVIDFVRETAIELIEQIKPRGECEFMADFARVLPVVVFLKMVDLPQADRPMLQELAEATTSSGALEHRQRGHERMRAYVSGWVGKRMANPGDDVLSRLCAGEIDGQPITREQAEGVCHLLVTGGLDTVASMIGFSAWRLAREPENRRKARERLGDPQRLRAMVEELIRLHGLANLARRATHDFSYKGVAFRKDDLIMIPNPLAGLDEARVERPLELDFEREAPIYHAAFGNGVHTCPGATLARREVMIFLQEWLTRIPDFEVKAGTTPACRSGPTNTMIELRLTWPV